MLGRKQEINLQAAEIIDGILLVVALWLAYVVRLAAGDVVDRQIPPFEDFTWLLFVIMPFGPILLEMHGFYSHPLQKPVWRSIIQMGRAAFWLCVLIGACVIFFRLDVPSRSALLLFAAFAPVLLLVRERVTMLWLRRNAESGHIKENVLLVGVPMDVKQLRDNLSLDQAIELNIVGEIDIERQPISELIEKLHKQAVSRVIFACGHSHMNRVQEAIAACEIEGVEAWLLTDFIKTSIARPDFDTFGGRPMLVFRSTPQLSWALLLKGLIDFVGAAVLLLLLSPLFLVAAVGIKLTSPGPIFFTQMRAGKNGRPFTMYKFRSMNTNAEMQRAELAARNQMSGPVFKVEKDPRITKFGAWLRKFSIDELPQLMNVLQGHMSLVGPRPLPLYEVEQFENTAQRRRLSVKPGLTCLWQVSGRNNVNDFQDWVKLDLDYIDNWSIWLDLVILVRTIPAVLLVRGAR